MYKCLNYNLVDDVATIKLTTGMPVNKIHNESMTELICALKEAVSSGARAIVLKGQDDIFCGGGTIGDFRTMTGPEINDFGALLQEMIFTMKSLPIPIIASVSGDANGGGLSLLEACDMAICVKEATFAIPEIKGGFCPAVALVSVDHAFTHAIAKRMAMTGESIDSKTALDYGLVQDVVEKDQLDTAVQTQVDKVLAGNPTAYKVTKEIAFKLSENELRNSFTIATGKLVEFLSSYDAGEVVTANNEDRTKAFKRK
jgi:enoyl-CoA hydratase/carnithine racemase